MDRLSDIAIKKCIKCGKYYRFGKWVFLTKEQEDAMKSLYKLEALCDQC